MDQKYAHFCDGCGAKFDASSVQQLHCTNACKQRSYRLRLVHKNDGKTVLEEAPRHKKLSIVKKCLYCGEPTSQQTGEVFVYDKNGEFCRAGCEFLYKRKSRNFRS